MKQKSHQAIFFFHPSKKKVTERRNHSFKSEYMFIFHFGKKRMGNVNLLCNILVWFSKYNISYSSLLSLISSVSGRDGSRRVNKIWISFLGLTWLRGKACSVQWVKCWRKFKKKKMCQELHDKEWKKATLYLLEDQFGKTQMNFGGRGRKQKWSQDDVNKHHAQEQILKSTFWQRQRSKDKSCSTGKGGEKFSIHLWTTSGAEDRNNNAGKS